MPASGPASFRSILTEGVIIALGSAYIYLVTFVYELGYCAHFGIPREFINPNLTTILVAAATIGFVLFTSIQLLGFSVPLIRAATNPSERQKPYQKFFFLNALYLVFGIVLWGAYGYAFKTLIVILVAAVVLNVFYFGIDLFVLRKGGIRERFEASRDEPDSFNIVVLFADKFGFQSVGFTLIVATTLVYAYFIGNGEAFRQERFLVLKDSQDFVLLRTYGDLMIAANVDRTKKVTGNDILLLRTSSKDKFEFRTEKLGPLKKQANIVATAKETSSSPEKQPAIKPTPD